MISVIITSYKEPRTIGRAVEKFIPQISKSDEIIVVAPDKETLDEAEKYKKSFKSLKTLKDSGRGKPAALNLAVKKARGDIIVFTDGDVYVSDNAVSELLHFMKDKNIGAVSGNPVSIDDRGNKYGYWAHLLTKIADERRQKAIKLGRRFFCSGYLFAIRKNIIPKLPEELLSEDGFISHRVYQSGYKIEYAEKARVFVKYPDNFRDWIKQKKRSAGGYNQIRDMLGIEIRSFKTESKGAFGLLKYCQGLKEFWWLIELFIARLYLWAVIYRDINLKRKNHRDIWQRVESTK